MFLEVLRRRNPEFLEAIVQLHRRGDLPSNTYALDLDAISANARYLSDKASDFGVEVLAMTKQVGRNPDLCKSIIKSGIKSAVAVDLECGWYAHQSGLSIGHIGHLVQIPKCQVPLALSLQPDAWTVFSLEQALAISNVVRDSNNQRVYLRVYGPKDQFYRGHEGGFEASTIIETAKQIDDLHGLEVSGITSFPALLFDREQNALSLTPNATTVRDAAEIVEETLGRPMARNMPGTTSTAAIEMLADAGATQIEPGHALTGTTPLHSIKDLVEKPAIAYVSEVSHHYSGSAFVIGGGLYRDPVLGDQETCALVFGPDGSPLGVFRVEMPKASAIDYYCIIFPSEQQKIPPVGSTVIFGFRVQAFVTRAQTVAISGVSRNSPIAGDIFSASGASSFLAQRVETK